MMDELKSTLSGSASGRDDVIFIDEVTFSSKTFRPYAWSHTAQSVTQTAILGSQPCQAVVGAASASQGLIVWHISERSFNAEGIRDFLQDLRDCVGPGRRTIMLDNASIHRSKATVDHARLLDFQMIWNVPYHPEFNGIEYVWAVVKARFRAIQTQRMMGTKACSFVEAVWAAMSGVTDVEVKRCI